MKIVIIPPCPDERWVAREYKDGNFDLPRFGLIELRGARIFYTTFSAEILTQCQDHLRSI